MDRCSESDWELVNAFHDGELSDEDAAEFERRLANEPALSEALDQVSGVSKSLKALRPEKVAAPTLKNKYSRTKISMIGFAAAAAMIAFVAWSMQPRAMVLLEMHQALQQESFTVSTEDVRNVALSATLGVHDLRGANLAPVSIQSIPHGTLAHYAGLNGCRLSYFNVDLAFELPSDKNVQAIAWTTADGGHHAIVATGMDIKRFESIAIYLQHITHNLAKSEVYASMTDATHSAAPCTG
ncbi:MAG: hypothetical protein AAGK67_13890 [Pseudomonadota bacterium]